MPEMKKYRALKRGYTDRIHEPGDVFFYGGPKGSWMEEVKEEAEQEAPAKTGKAPAKK